MSGKDALHFRRSLIMCGCIFATAKFIAMSAEYECDNLSLSHLLIMLVTIFSFPLVL